MALRLSSPRGRRGFVLVLLAPMLILLLPASRATAEVASASISEAGYYTRTEDPTRTGGAAAAGVACQVPSPDPRTCLNPGQITGGTPGYPRKDNYVYVARFNGADDAYGFAKIDLTSIPFDAVVKDVGFEFQVEASAETGTVGFNAEEPGIRLCLVTSDWAGADAGPFDSRPSTDCAATAGIKKIGHGTRTEFDPSQNRERTRDILIYRADLLPMAAEWAKGRENYGVAFLPAPGAPANFQAAIRGPGVAPDAMTAAITFEGGSSPLDELIAAAEAELAAGDSGTAFGDSSLAGDAVSLGSAGDSAPTFSVAAPKEEPRGLSGVRVARSIGRTPWWVWLALPLGLGTLYMLALGVTAAAPVEASARRAGPVSKLMERRPTRGVPRP